MIFSSVFFIFAFLPVFLIAYYVIPFTAGKNLVLLLFSLIFYAWGEPVYVILMLLNIAINYVGGLELEYYIKRNEMRKAKCACIVTVTVDLLVLGFYKYYGFLLENLNAFLPVHIPYRELALPIGISFYTFQTLSYIIDVYRGNIKAQRDPIAFGAYVSMFPQLIAGPIVRYADVAAQLRSRRHTLVKFGDGVMWFVRGLGKKALIANSIGSIYESIAVLDAAGRSVLTAWIGCFAYTMQIYFDFSGYSDMAIGLGKMLGFDLMKNFDHPYISKSITEFWRRWHISLSSWFKEYVYIPLGGNRHGTFNTIRNLMIVWMLTGFWHGAAWNFLLWGLYYGVILCLEKYVFSKLLSFLPAVLQHIYTMFLVMIGWVLFFSNSLGGTLAYLGNLFGINGSGIADAAGFYFLRTSLVLGIIAILGSTPLLHRLSNALIASHKKVYHLLCVLLYGGVFLISVAYLVNETYNPFLYFRF